MTSKHEVHVCLRWRGQINVSFLDSDWFIYDENSGLILPLLRSECPPSGQGFFFFVCVQPVSLI